MPLYTFRLPDIGEGIAEAEIVAWHVAVGDQVPEDGRLADVMTDKATVEMESPVAGRIVELAGGEGDRIAIGAPLVVIETDGEAVEPVAPPVSAPAPAPEPVAEPVDAPTPPPAPAPAPVNTPRVLASPAVRARARDLGIDLAQVRSEDPQGRIRHGDLDRYITYNAGGGFAAPGSSRPDETVRVIGLRRRIAENMAASKRHIPHFTYVEEIDVTALEELRADLNAQATADRPRLTMLPLLITAICRTLPRFAMLNARYDDEAGIVTRHGAVHLGIATQTDEGLKVPVLRNAQDRNLWQLAREIARLAQAARDGSIGREELGGSTLTLTSLGPLGGVATTPVINRPEVAIIGPNRIVERPMFVPDGLGGERIAKRKLMNLSISCDHRVVDGWDAASFVQAVRGLLEKPALLLVG